MPLPKIDLPLYDLTIPSTGKTIKVRPFVVKEEKLLLMALEGKNPIELVATVKQVINNCIQDDSVDIEKLPFFDVDYMFIFLRAKSVGETVTVNMTCNNVVDGKTCGHVFQTEMDIGKIDIIDPEKPNDIRLTGKTGVKMKYPSYAIMRKLEQLPDLDKKTEVICASIDYVYDDKGMYKNTDYTPEELKEFVENLTEEGYQKLEDWVDSFPSIAALLDAKCEKCGFEHQVRYTDFIDFFI
jgi:hypothetical protein